MDNLKDKALDLFYISEFSQAAAIFQEIIDSEPETKFNYYYLGLCYLLQGDIDEAQITWWLTIDEELPSTNQLTKFLSDTGREFGIILNRVDLANAILGAAVDLEPENTDLLRELARFLLFESKSSDCIEVANAYISSANTLYEKLFGYSIIMCALMQDGFEWENIFNIANQQIELIQSLSIENSDHLVSTDTNRLFCTTFFLSYISDDPIKNRTIQNQLSQFLAKVCQVSSENLSTKVSSNYEVRPLKIGYISHCLRRHSVGWLARWIFEHHDRDNFKIYAYLLADHPGNDSVKDRIIPLCEQAYRMGTDAESIIRQIKDDEIDILVDLDSLTSDLTCQIMAVKPAPIQITWLGWDASGIPAIDYFIADPYVLPANAQEYYSEKIWRLPNTYLAVDGFEVLFPTIHRSQFDIPQDSIVYFTSQTGYKRHPDTVKLQMQILKGVPNSYLFIKGSADKESLRQFFRDMAEEVGVSGDRLRFLPTANTEAEHRANLDIADVVLDTYPYTGATTTMETLWMCIPMVTRVGQQFAARNSYTMMMNAGISEGIAWTDVEYVEWGIKLGTDENLRKQVFWKLKESRKTSPLWNAKQFTKNMENAYTQMWNIYIQ
jgi:predicted O-linked N-acetylglucosamine transferase (SPINDLY family)